MKKRKCSSLDSALKYIRGLKKKKIKGYLSSEVLKAYPLDSDKPWKIQWSVSYKKRK